MNRTLQSFPDSQLLYDAAARLFTDLVFRTLRFQKICSVVLSGGSTPLGLYERLAREPYARTLPWGAIHVFWGDERWVPPEHHESNFGSARRALLGHTPIPSAHVHPVPVATGSPFAAACRYEAEIRRFLRRNRWTERTHGFDIMLLGIGADGHTASLFPGDSALNEMRRWVVPVEAPPTVTPRRRITMTLPLISASRHVVFLAAGCNKKAAVRYARKAYRVQNPSCPASLVSARRQLVWLTAW